MGHSPARTKATLVSHAGVQEMIRLQASLHQRLTSARTAEHHASLCCIDVIGGFLEPIMRYVDAVIACQSFDPISRTNQYRIDQTCPSRIGGTLQSNFAQRVNDCGYYRLEVSTLLDEMLKNLMTCAHDSTRNYRPYCAAINSRAVAIAPSTLSS